MNALVDRIMAASLTSGQPLRHVATELAKQIDLSACARPYGEE